jgi:hypothetical protein
VSDKALTAGQLRAALLRVVDLPKGYSVSTDDEDEDTSDASACAKKFVSFDRLDKDVSASSSAKISYEKDTTFIGEELHVLADTSAARDLVDSFRAFARQCSKLIVSDSQGTLNAKVTAIDLPDVGDGVTGFNVAGTVSAFPISLNFAAAHVGRTVLVLSHGGLGPVVDDVLTRSLVTKAIGRLETCVKQSCAELPLSALPTPSVLKSASPDVARTWPTKWCSARLGMTRAQMRAVMGNPTEEFLPDSGTPQMSWDAFEFQFTAFLDVNDRVRQLDVNDIQLTKAERASIHCEFTRVAE